MVLSPFHLLKARITVEANVSVSFITVIIQLSHTASTLPSHHDDVTGRKLQNSRAGINPSGALLISTFSAWGLQTGLHDGHHGGPSRVVRQPGIHHSFPVIGLFQGLRFVASQIARVSPSRGGSPRYPAGYSIWSLRLVTVETAGWGPGAPGLAEPAPQFE